MSSFATSTYLDRANSTTKSSAKIGFFKKLADGEIALARINISSIEELKTNTQLGACVHKPAYGAKYEGLRGFSGVSCLNELYSNDDKCPFCRAAANGHPVVTKVSKNIYIPMLISYKDPATGQWLPAEPVIWERPAGFAKDLAAKMAYYPDLREVLMLITRLGSGTSTRYTLEPAPPMLSNTVNIPVDFSAFENFDVSKHSYWVKSAEDMTAYLTTGAFPEIKKETEGDSVEVQSSFQVTPEARAEAEAPLFGPQPNMQPQPAPAPQFNQAPTATGAYQNPQPSYQAPNPFGDNPYGYQPQPQPTAQKPTAPATGQVDSRFNW